MAEREPGYYLVVLSSDHEPEPALWDGKGWTILGCPTTVGDEDVVIIRRLDLQAGGFV